MTQVEFHFNVRDVLAHARGLAATALGGRQRHVFVADPPALRAFDQVLWGAQPLSFFAHCTDASPPSVRDRSTVWLTESLARLDGNIPVVINLGQQVPVGFERADRLIEIVPQDDEGRAAGRQRWRHYADRGYAIARHDCAQGSPG